MDEVVAFLGAISQKDLEAALRSSAAGLPIIPTTEGVLKPSSVTHFNDLGPHVDEVELPPGHSIASNNVERRLALKLGLSFLSDLVGKPDDDGLLEMREDLTTRISSVLVKYTEKQALMEFLANAADAEATEFGVTLDTTQYPFQGNYQFITEGLKELYSCSSPSLILHNDSIFTSSDWKGICSIGSGSKKESMNGKLKIGRFGLGALSMFYFTEVPQTLTIYEYVLIFQFQGCNDSVWPLCPLYGSQKRIPWKGSFMLWTNIFRKDEEVCQLHY